MAFMASAIGCGPHGPPARGARGARQRPANDLRRAAALRSSPMAWQRSTATPRYVQTLALVERVDVRRSRACRAARPRLAAPRAGGPAHPLADEFARTLDVFPLEYGNIIAITSSIAATDPFAGMRVAEADRRRGCEQQAKSHLIHLREGFLETQGDPRQRRAADRVVGARVPRAARQSDPARRRRPARPRRATSRPTLPALAASIERTIGVPAPLDRRSPVGAVRHRARSPTRRALLARYIDASERIWRYVDGWRA